jgi:hypothetical protein
LAAPALGGSVVVNDPAEGPERTDAPAGSYPALAPDGRGGLLLAWTETGRLPQVRLRRLDAAGNPRGADATLAFAGTTGGRCGLGGAPDGACLVIWPPQGRAVPGDLWGVFFTPDGAAAAPPSVLTDAPAAPGPPAAASLGAGGRALAAWTDRDGAVRALTWTEPALPALPAAWGTLHGLYRGKH